MAIKINSNGQSLAAQRQVAHTSDSLGRVFERLSSGQRINRASDDAAGLAIADTLNVKSRVFTAGVRNLNDGVSLLSVADVAVSSLTNITVRLKELAEQSANGVYSNKQRQAIDNEAQALSKEFTRITQTTSFNGLALFDGSSKSITLQAGYGINGAITSSLGGSKGTGEFVDVNQAGNNSGVSQVFTDDFNNDGKLDLLENSASGIAVAFGKGDGTFSAEISTNLSGSIISGQADINGDGNKDIIFQDGFYALNLGNGTFSSPITIANSGYLTVADVDGNGTTDAVVFAGSLAKVYLNSGNGSFSFSNSFTVAGGDVKFGDFNGDGNLDLAAINFSDPSIVLYSGNGKGNFGPAITTSFASAADTIGDIAIGDFNNDGIADIAVDAFGGDVFDGTNVASLSTFLGTKSGTFTSAPDVTIGYASYYSLKTGDVNGDGALDLISGEESTVEILTGNGNGSFNLFGTFDAGIPATSVAAGDFDGDSVLDLVASHSSNWGYDIFLGKNSGGIASITSFSLASVQGSRDALKSFGSELTKLSQQRAQIGAFQSRIETAINVLQSSTENFKAAESRIRDTDIAKDSAELVRLQILQQAGISVLSQANLQPQIALKLQLTS